VEALLSNRHERGGNAGKVEKRLGQKVAQRSFKKGKVKRAKGSRREGKRLSGKTKKSSSPTIRKRKLTKRCVFKRGKWGVQKRGGPRGSGTGF